MIKTRVTQKAIRANYSKIIRIGYCDAQYLLKYTDPMYYTTRAEGWASDVYDIDGVAISTGYAPFGNIKPLYDLTEAYERRAEEIYKDPVKSYDERKKTIEELLKAFIKEVIK